MSMYDTTHKKRIDRTTDPRPAHFILGVDERGAHHIADTTGELDTVHIVHSDGSRGRRIVPPDRSLDEYMAAVGDAQGWRVERYGKDCVDILTEAVDP